jgi:hypothetical protein
MTKADSHPKPRRSRVLRILLRAFLVFWILVLLDGYFTHLPIQDLGRRAPGELVGILHVHTRVSHDGGGTLEGVIQAARDARLDFVTITEHNIAFDRSRLNGLPNDVIVLPGEEVSTPNGHFEVLGVTPGWRDASPHPTEELLQRAGQAGGIRIIAHPFNGAPRWNYWDTAAFDGMEIWNDDAQWRRAGPELLVTALMYPLNPELALTRLATRPDPNLAKWDELLRTRHVVGTCGSDAHEAIILGGHLLAHFPKYVNIFRISRQHVLLSSVTEPGKPAPRSPDSILDALRKGHTFCAVDSLAPTSGFQEQVTSGAATAGIGDTLPYDAKSVPKLRIALPATPSKPLIKIYKDGEEWLTSSNQALEREISAPGVYRTEVWLRQPGLTGWNRWTPWIIANPIYIEAAKQ